MGQEGPRGPCSVACGGSEWPQAGLGLGTTRVPKSKAWGEPTQAPVNGTRSCRIQDMGRSRGCLHSSYVAEKGLGSDRVQERGGVCKDGSSCVSAAAARGEGRRRRAGTAPDAGSQGRAASQMGARPLGPPQCWLCLCFLRALGTVRQVQHPDGPLGRSPRARGSGTSVPGAPCEAGATGQLCCGDTVATAGEPRLHVTLLFSPGLLFPH